MVSSQKKKIKEKIGPIKASFHKAFSFSMSNSDSQTINENLALPQFPLHIEKQLKTQLIAVARENCLSHSEAYADCTRYRTVTVPWSCKKLLNEMNICMKQL